MPRIQNFTDFLAESASAEKRECVADVQIRFVVSSEPDPRKLVLQPEKFVPTPTSRREVGQTVRVAAHAGQFIKTGAYGGYAYKGEGNEKTVKITTNDYFTLAFTPAELQNGTFQLTLDNFPETLHSGELPISLRQITVLSDNKPGTSSALKKRGSTEQKGMSFDGFQENGASGTTLVKGDAVTCTLSGARNVIYVVYAPGAPDAEGLRFRFDNVFDHNSTRLLTTQPAYTETIAALLAQFKKGNRYELVVHGNASKVPTTYQSKLDSQDGAPVRGNEALAHDRAKALLTRVKEEAQKAGIKFDAVVPKTKVEYAVTGDEYDGDANEKEKYDEYQFTEVRLTVTTK